MNCCGTECYQEQFGAKHAANDVKRYRAKGPDRTTRLLVDALKKEGVKGSSLADVVTLDRVICCYPNMEELVSASASRARRLNGVVFPRERWLTRGFVAITNVARRLRRNSFRSYVHSVDAIDAAVRRQGLRLRSATETVSWRVAVYSRYHS